jgi:energy-coupling factor transport system substrate-specific component
MSWGTLSWLILIFLFVTFFYVFERGKPDSKKIALTATLTALAAVTRIPFAAIPNVQPTTFFVIISGYVFGPKEGFVVGAGAAVVSNMFLGHGPWTPWQMIAWGAAGLSAGLLGKLNPDINRSWFAAFCGVWGIIYGMMMNVWQWSAFVFPLTYKTFFATYLAGIVFDVLHASGNICFAYLMGNDLIKILKRFKDRLKYTYIS